MSGTNTLSASMSRAAIEQTKKDLQVISEQRGIFGASQNKLEHAYNGVGNTLENTQASESLIRDTDMVKEYSKLSAHNILEQTGQAMLAQANRRQMGCRSRSRRNKCSEKPLTNICLDTIIILTSM